MQLRRRKRPPEGTPWVETVFVELMIEVAGTLGGGVVSFLVWSASESRSDETPIAIVVGLGALVGCVAAVFAVSGRRRRRMARVRGANLRAGTTESHA